MSEATFDPEQRATSRRVVFFGNSQAAWWDVPVLPGLRCERLARPNAAGYAVLNAALAPLLHTNTEESVE